MSISEVLGQLLLGMVLGAIGQGLRALVGLKKAQDSAASAGTSFNQTEFDGTRLGISLFIGALVGGLTILVLSSFKPLPPIDDTLIYKLIAVGYAGTDAIEGLMQKFLPQGVSNPAATRNLLTQTTPQSLLLSAPARARVTIPASDAALAGVSASPAGVAITPGQSLEIQLNVSRQVFPACSKPGPGGRVTVDPSFSIGDACAAAPDNVALETNLFASELAQANAVNWKNVTGSDISPLKTIKDLMALVAKNLS